LSNSEEQGVLMEDLNYAASWDKNDYTYVSRLFKEIQMADDYGEQDIVERLSRSYERKITRKFEGQYIPDIKEDPAPIDVSFQKDVITNQGMGRIVSILVGKTNARFNHYASGDGTSVATVGDTRLQSEKFRISMTTDGFMTAAGTVARYGAVFIPSAPSHTVTEAAVFDSAVGGTPLNRTLYPSSQRIVHTIFVDFYSLSIALYLSSV
jgi:hypothetical protein